MKKNGKVLARRRQARARRKNVEAAAVASGPTAAAMELAKPSKSSVAPLLWSKLIRWRSRIALIITIIGGVYSVIPKVDLQTSVNISQNETYGTQFIVTNRSWYPIFDVHFNCTMNSVGAGSGPTLTDISMSNLVAKVLWPNQSDTQGCRVAGIANQNSSADIEVSYRPIYYYRWSTRGHFRAIRGTSGFFLVPAL